MLYFRPGNERGRANFGWLDSHHSFSFGHYYDPKHMGFLTPQSNSQKSGVAIFIHSYFQLNFRNG